MKICVSFSKKVPGEEEYSSLGSHLQIEVEAPPELREDRAKLRGYIQALFRECRDRVEEDLQQDQPQAPAPTNGHLPRTRRPLAASRSRAPSSNGRNGRNGHTSNGHASPKQVNFVRALASQAGMSYEDLSDLAAECFGKTDLRQLSKREASQLIDDLRPDDRR